MEARGAGGNLAEQAVSAALAYRVQQPIIDAVLNEIGMNGNDLQAMVGQVSKETLSAKGVTAQHPEVK